VASFTVDGREYELITLDQLADMELGDLEILEEVGGLDLATLDDPDGVPVTIKLVVALTYVSMLKSNPDATLAMARKAKAVGVVESLAEQVANTTTNGAASPPTKRAASGHPRSKSASASGPGR
jgi:hypothetical protein